MQDQGPGDGKGTSAAVVRRRIEMAMLELCGEVGYRAVTPEMLLVRSGATPDQLRTHCGDLATCFAAAYEAEAEDLCGAMLSAAGEAGDWRAATEAALTIVLRFAGARPQIARALVREVHIAGGPALVKHEELLERLAAAMGEECKAPVSDLDVPRAPTFVVGAVEGVIAGHLDRGEERQLLEAGPELMDLIATFFDGANPGAQN
jgi:hypothetical protein